jgi:hypothetical protein
MKCGWAVNDVGRKSIKLSRIPLALGDLGIVMASLICNRTHWMYLKRSRDGGTSTATTAMASSRENAAGSAPDERAPLLGNEDTRHDTVAIPDEDEPSLEPEKARSKIWYYAWRGFWAILAILVIAVFVKGWIDADDVNVSLHMPATIQLDGTNRTIV